MLLTTPMQDMFRTTYSNVLTTRPAAAFGTSLTPTASGYNPSWTNLSITATRDCFGMMVNINSGSTSNAAKNRMVQIGIDRSGGTSYTQLIPGLLGACAFPYNIGTAGTWYYFPIYIPAGSTLGASAGQAPYPLTTCNVAVWIYGDPVDPASIKYGQGVQAIGLTTTTCAGTAVTAGGASEGGWTSLGTNTYPSFYWQCGMGCNDTSMTALVYGMDLAADNNANPRMLVSDVAVVVTSTEQLGYNCVTAAQNCEMIPAGTTIYGRLQCSGTADSNLSMVAYGVY